MPKKFDREPIAWITRGGKHVPIFEKEDGERKAKLVTEEGDVISGSGSYKKNIHVKDVMIEIDNYGRVDAQSFINRLVEKGRLGREYLKNITKRYSDEWYTKMLNENLDLFPKQF